MTPKQVSALSDDELNIAMLTSYMPYWKSDKDISRMVRAGKINYLTDYNQTMPLVVENRLWLQPAQATPRGWFSYNDSDKSSLMCSNPLRAACECLVLIALADK